ncbi:hypothetical protein BBD39_06040 [Arsenophonus endosymbiont of Bemisia tabaci Asia II 3]|nr:hypothetical protein BBD39_06040 [Arsenophonus endosymbiont of Bemisia tabaci Asia II 3]
MAEGDVWKDCPDLFYVALAILEDVMVAVHHGTPLEAMFMVEEAVLSNVIADFSGSVGLRQSLETLISVYYGLEGDGVR